MTAVYLGDTGHLISGRGWVVEWAGGGGGVRCSGRNYIPKGN